MIDEVQDFAGNDFNLLKLIANANLKKIFVGDFYQHTFDTSKDGNVNVSLHKNYQEYQKRLKDMGFTPDSSTLDRSHRCSPTVCDFVTSKLGIAISSHRSDETFIGLVEDIRRVNEIYESSSIVKLFYKESNKRRCYAVNWGVSKGQDHYNDVCVVLNPTTFKAFKNGTLSSLAPSTRNKLYVAITRSRRDVYFVSDNLTKGIP